MLNRRLPQSILIFRQAPPDFQELRAEHDRLDRGAETVIVRLELPLHFLDQQQIREGHLAAQCVAEQLPAKLLEHIVHSLGGEVFAQANQALDASAVRELCPRIDGVEALSQAHAVA